MPKSKRSRDTDDESNEGDAHVIGNIHSELKNNIANTHRKRAEKTLQEATKAQNEITSRYRTLVEDTHKTQLNALHAKHAALLNEHHDNTLAPLWTKMRQLDESASKAVESLCQVVLASMKEVEKVRAECVGALKASVEAERATVNGFQSAQQLT